MSRTWTEDQSLAIHESGTNIIVSAGAGSGKTAVLTERVIEKLRHGVSVRSLLILTFTNAAASEMKERIRSSLQKEENLQEQLEALDSAYITTFDSYALSLVKKYHYLLQLPKKIKITSSSIVSLKRKEFLDQIFDSLYKEKDPEFVSLIHSFCIKGDQNLRNAVLKFDDKLNLRTDKQAYLTSYIDFYYEDKHLDKLVSMYLDCIKEQIEALKIRLKELEDVADGDYYYTIYDVIKPILGDFSYQAVKDVRVMKLKNVPKGSPDEVKETKQKIAQILKELSELTIYESEEQMKEELRKTRDFAKVFVRILQELDEKVTAWKTAYHAYEFHDISRLSLELLKNHPEIRESLKNEFSEILVDEYQDTNDIQEEFISYIGNHNVYMVGDIKQSIYQFRNANPYIFKSKYDAYREHKNGRKIDLIKNFRSRKEVLDDINTLFIPIMGDQVGGADYELEHQMVPGNVLYDTKGKTNENYHMDILNYTYERGYPYTRREIEIFIIAQDIKEKIAQKYPVFEMGSGATRPIQYRDFTILLQTGSDYELYKKIFLYLGIPLQVYQDETIKTSYDMHVIKNIFILLNSILHKEKDATFKHAFMSVGRSFLMEMTDQHLFEVLTNGTYEETELYRYCTELLTDINTISFKELLDRILLKFEFYDKLIKVGNISHTLSRLDYLKSVAEEVSSLGFSLDEFIVILEEVLNGDEDIKMKGILDQSNTVKLMNIHKSKGLEFPICYFASLDRDFNTDDIRGNLLYDKTLGFILPFYNDGLKETIVKTIYKNQYLKELISERIRLFYVALTRAKEKIILVTDLSKQDATNARKIPVLEKLKYRSLNDMLCSIKDQLNDYIVPVQLEQLSLSKNYMLELKVQLKDRIRPTEDTVKMHSFEVKQEELEDIHYSKDNHDLWEEDLTPVLTLGNEVHLILETLDFHHPDLSFIQSDLLQTKIAHFLELPLLKDIHDGKVYQEYAFYDSEKKTTGVIDLFIVYEDHIDVIDYKLNDIKDSAYQCQVQAYQAYLEKTFEKPVSGYLYSILKEEILSVN